MVTYTSIGQESRIMGLSAAGKFGIAVVVLSLFLANQVVGKLDRYTGSWFPTRAWIDGQEVKINFWFSGMEITSSRHISIDEYWSCGARRQEYADGKLVVWHGRAFICDEDADGKVSDYYEAELFRTPQGSLRYVLPDHSEGTIMLEFEREPRANLFALFERRSRAEDE
jgi:hypothetical protein